MDTCRFQGLANNPYIVPGETRVVTGTTVMIMGNEPIQFCPYTMVDQELDLICNMAKVSSSPLELVDFYSRLNVK